MMFGLPETTIERIKAVLARHPEIEKAILYGSRAKGNFRKGSDIDLTLVGPAPNDFAVLYRVMDELEELLLPYFLDVSLLATISDTEVREHIGRVGKVLYTRENSHIKV